MTPMRPARRLAPMASGRGRCPCGQTGYKPVDVGGELTWLCRPHMRALHDELGRLLARPEPGPGRPAPARPSEPPEPPRGPP